MMRLEQTLIMIKNFFTFCLHYSITPILQINGEYRLTCDVKFTNSKDKDRSKERIIMSDQEVYIRFIEWLNKAWWTLGESEHLLPSIMAFYTPEEAALLTGIPFSGTNLEELADIKGMDPTELAPKLDALARKGAVWRSVKGETVRYSLNDTFFVFRNSRGFVVLCFSRGFSKAEFCF